MFCMNSEYNRVQEMSENITTTPSVDISDIEEFLKIHVNYKVDSSTHKISLYFNYHNFINSPYIKVEDSNIKTDTIETTYLKLD